MRPANPVHKPSRFARVFRILIPYVAAGVCLFWVFHDIQLAALLHSMAGLSWWLLCVAILLQFAAYLCVAWEWQLLLQPVGLFPVRRAAQAVFAGRFANDALPMQLGYLVRAYLASRWMNIRFASVLPSLIVERLWDGLWLALGIGLVTLLVPLPPDMLRARNFLAAVVLTGTAAAVLAVLLRRKSAGRSSPDAAGRPIHRLLGVIGRLADGVHDISRSGRFAPIFGLSLFKLAIQALAFYVLLWAYGLHPSGWVGLAVFLLGYLGICIPSTPASTGVFQLFVVGGLGLFGIDKTTAAGFALVAFAAMTAPIAVAGSIALARSGITLRQIREGIRKADAPSRL